MPPQPHFRAIELFIPEMKQLLAAHRLDELKALVSEINPIDLADGFEEFPLEEQLLLFKLLRPGISIVVFEELDLPRQEYIIQHLDDETLSPLLQDIPSDVTARLFKKLPDRIVRKMANLMRKEQVDVIHDIIEYPAHTVGALMNTDVLRVAPETTSRAAIEMVQARSRLRTGKILDTVFVCDRMGRVLGQISLTTLIGAPSGIQVKDVMSSVAPIRILARMDREEAAKTLSHYKVLIAPVVDEDNKLLGAITADDVIDVIQKEDTEDIQKLAGVQAFEDPYLETPLAKMVKKRALWLCVLFLGETLTASAMAFFEKEIAQAVVLALFIPLIISSGGNSGSQAATLVVRAMALKEVTLADWWRVVRREFASGLALGSILGALGFMRIFLWSLFTDIYGPHVVLVGVTVGFSLVLVVLWGTLSGSVLPILLRRAGLDPAVASAPFVATLVDVTGLMIYFTTGLFVLKGTLL